jgi:hypothetical protein
MEIIHIGQTWILLKRLVLLNIQLMEKYIIIRIILLMVDLGLTQLTGQIDHGIANYGLK